MKQLVFALCLTSTSALAGGPETFYGPNGESGTVTRYGSEQNGYAFYHSNRGSGSSTSYNGTTYYRGYRPGSGGQKGDTRTDPLD